MAHTTSDKEEQVRELFQARFTIDEILERTGLTIDSVVRVINAPRVRRNQLAPGSAGADSNQL